MATDSYTTSRDVTRIKRLKASRQKSRQSFIDHA
jgi:hypothetical protein